MQGEKGEEIGYVLKSHHKGGPWNPRERKTRVRRGKGLKWQNSEPEELDVDFFVELGFGRSVRGDGNVFSLRLEIKLDTLPSHQTFESVKSLFLIT